ncbi:Signal transduction histidine-protein kinase BaeS [Marinomonas spartinae]|uniref:histidine kinase n=1 Tax=Marinomonas spartinae TaxID=1792290 RepID=A0A1A8TGP9_9GAMM|nr:ATP-binding protein [Marinomonas spartinae]SBS31445.1 Signal transduction histidine-protein kinase BaeS [Marinomonas spartinae]SBS32097.1 Signal transduction histidine-protein kinase BaeS [Marinomonas spartinae]
MTFTKKIKIRHKLFVVFVLSNILVIVSMWQVFQWSFDKGFVSYATARDRDFLEQMANRTANLYAYYNDWYFLVQESRMEKKWNQTRLENLRDLIPPPSTPNLDLIYPSQYYRQRFLLFDKNQKNLIGRVPFDKAETHAVIVNKKIVGYVGLRSMRAVVQDQTLRFVQQQGEAFLLISAFILAIAALLTWPLAQWLSRPICTIREATRKLATGKFDTRIKIQGTDELADLGTDFNHLATTLENTRESRKRWVADTAHELRTPVAILRGEIEAMQDGIIKVSPESLESLQQEIVHIARLIDDLNQLSMHDMGNLNYEMEEVDLADTLEQTSQSMSLIYKEAGLDLELEVTTKHPILINGDENRLHQLFANLMNNSLKYTNTPGRLKITLREEKNLAIVLFEDTPPGVNEEEKQRIFEQFYRVENSRNRATGGRGLGLAICTNIVNAHQGTIKAYHSPEGGLGIRIEFPLH